MGLAKNTNLRLQQKALTVQKVRRALRFFSTGIRTPGLSKQHKLETDELLWQDTVPEAEHPEMRFVSLPKRLIYSVGDCNGDAATRESKALMMRPVRSILG